MPSASIGGPWEGGPPETAAEQTFVSHINPSCRWARARFPSQTLGPLNTQSYSAFPPSVPFRTTATLSSSSWSSSALPSSAIATATTSQPTQSTSQQTQTPSTGRGETNNLIIGLVVAIVFLILLATTGLAYLCIRWKRRRRKDDIATVPEDVDENDSEEAYPQLYLQRKAELDDAQRRHELEAREVRYGMGGEDEIHEMPAGGTGRYSGRQELRGQQSPKELDAASLG